MKKLLNVSVFIKLYMDIIILELDYTSLEAMRMQSAGTFKLESFGNEMRYM